MKKSTLLVSVLLKRRNVVINIALKKTISGEGKFLGSGASFSVSEEFGQANVSLKEGLEAAFRLNKDMAGSTRPKDCSRALTALKQTDDLSDSETTKKMRELLKKAVESCTGKSKDKKCNEQLF